MKTHYDIIVERVKSGDDLIDLLNIHDGEYEKIPWDEWVNKNLIETVLTCEEMSEALWDNYLKFAGTCWEQWFDEGFCTGCKKVPHPVWGEMYYCDIEDGCKYFPYGLPEGSSFTLMWLKAPNSWK